MKSIKEYILESNILAIQEMCLNEAALSKADFEKHNYKYIKGLLAKLLSGEDIRLGSKGTDGTVNLNDLTDDEQTLAQEFNDELVNNNYNDISIERFNSIFNSQHLKLSSFFKGDYSGYVDGLESKNKGNAFESYFINNYHEKFESEIKKIFPYKEFKGISADGGNNTKRPLTFSNDSITCGHITDNNYNIGAAVTDVTVNTENGKIYLSLKSGSSVTFVNAGVKKLFPDSWFNSNDKLTENGEQLLNMLCVDENRFKTVFNNYSGADSKRQRSQKDKVDIKDDLLKNTLFKKFMYSVMGYGYIMVHQIKGDNVEYIDLTSETDLKKYINDIKEAYVLYPADGKAKRVDVIVKFDGIEFDINIRNKQSGLYPTHIMADYKFI